jgi:hypothetical protein
MRRSIRSAPLLALCVISTLSTVAVGCRSTTTPDGKPPRNERATAQTPVEVALPDPLRLPAEPTLASWIAEPSAIQALLAPYSPVAIDLREGIEQVLAGVTAPALAAEIARAVALDAPLSNVILDDGQEVIRLSLDAAARASLAGRLGELEAIGEFGAVTLPASSASEVQPGPPREWLAWIDEGDGGTLVLANSLAGLVTGRQLAAAYGQQPVFFTVDPSALPLPVDLPLSRVTGRGDLSAIVIEAQATAGQDLLAQIPLRAGTLGGLLDGATISAGASSRYADHKEAVREIIVQVNSLVGGLPFLVRGLGQDLAAKLNTALRTWDGRFLAAMGPRNHVRLAFGASDVEKSRVAVLRLLQAVVDNVSLARNFSSQVPKMNLRRRVAKGDGEDVELFVVYDASSLAAELRPLADRDNRLNVAMAWSSRAGGGLFVVGPDASNELARWLDETKGSADHGKTQDQWLAASFAADPAQLRPLLASPNNPPAIGLDQLLDLGPTGPRWRVNIEDHGAGSYVIEIAAPGAPAQP